MLNASVAGRHACCCGCVVQDSKKGPIVDPEYLHWAPLPVRAAACRPLGVHTTHSADWYAAVYVMQMNLKKDKWSYRSKLRRNEGEE